MSFLVHGFGAMSRASDELTALRRIVSETAETTTPLRWTPGAQKLRDAFVLDGRAAQASYREIGCRAEKDHQETLDPNPQEASVVTPKSVSF